MIDTLVNEMLGGSNSLSCVEGVRRTGAQAQLWKRCRTGSEKLLALPPRVGPRVRWLQRSTQST